MRVFLFIIVIGLGIASLSLSMLSEEILDYYSRKIELRQLERSTRKTNVLIADYDALISEIDSDPNILTRLGSAVLGIDSNEPNGITVETTQAQLAVAMKVLQNQSTDAPAEVALPGWLLRCNKPRSRIVLFIAGSALILISFICFGAKKPNHSISS